MGEVMWAADSVQAVAAKAASMYADGAPDEDVQDYIAEHAIRSSNAYAFVDLVMREMDTILREGTAEAATTCPHCDMETSQVNLTAGECLAEHRRG